MHLLEVVNPLVPSTSDVLVVSAIWTGFGLVFYLWYLWSLSRLFPLLGLKGGWGWIPVWNDWQLLKRGGLPGWLVLLALVPGLGSLAVLVVRIIAMFRINTEFGKGAGMTVLGAVIAPLWAMLLTSHILDGRYGAAAAWAPVREDAPESSNVGALQGLPHANVSPTPAAFGAAPAAPAMPSAPEGLGSYNHTATQVQAPVSPQVQAPLQAPGQVPGLVQAPVQAPRSSFAPPLQNEQGDLAAPADQAPEFSELGFLAPIVPPAPAASEPLTVPEPNNWGFSNTTEGAYERLAAEGQQPQGSTPLGAQVHQQPFSWPAPQGAEQASPTNAEPVAAPAAVDPPASADLEIPGVPAAGMSEPVREESGPSIFDAPEPVSPEFVGLVDGVPSAHERGGTPGVAPTRAPEASGGQQDLIQAPIPAPVFAPVVAQGLADPEPPVAPSLPTAFVPASGAPVAPSGQYADVDDEEDDATIVVRRATRWGIKLPDGEVLELPGDDVVLGRRPEPIASTTVLQITDPTRTLSKSHVRLRRRDEIWTVEDLHSTNGVALINAAGETVHLEAGHEREATEQMLIGTLEVQLVRNV